MSEKAKLALIIIGAILALAIGFAWIVKDVEEGQKNQTGAVV